MLHPRRQPPPARPASLGQAEDTCIQGIQYYFAGKGILSYTNASGTMNPPTEALISNRFGPDWRTRIGSACAVLSSITLQDQGGGPPPVPFTQASLFSTGPLIPTQLPFGMTPTQGLLAAAALVVGGYLVSRGSKPPAGASA